jgi:hypothetical protein
MQSNETWRTKSSEVLSKRYENGVYSGSVKILALPKNRVSHVVREGRGAFHFDSGERYEGNWLKDKIDGQGIYTWPNGCRFEGEFKNGMMEGDGVFTWSDGKRFKGCYQAGKRIRKSNLADDHLRAPGEKSDVNTAAIESNSA